MGVTNGQNLQGVTENGATTNIRTTYKNATSDIAGLVADVTDSTGFAKVQDWFINGIAWLYAGTIFGVNGFVNQLNNAFFFGNSNAQNFYLMNPGVGHTMQVDGAAYNYTTAALDLGAKNLLSTGVFSDGSTPINSGHTHQGTGNTGAIIPHPANYTGNSLDTVYHNTIARPLIIHGSVMCSVKNFGDEAYVSCLTDASNPPTTLQSNVGVTWKFATALSDQEVFYHQFMFIVQPNHYWTLVTTQTGGGSVTLDTLDETPF